MDCRNNGLSEKWAVRKMGRRNNGLSEQWYPPVSSTNKTDSHDIAKILLKVALNTINQYNLFLKPYSYEHKKDNNKRRVDILFSAHDAFNEVFLFIQL